MKKVLVLILLSFGSLGFARCPDGMNEYLAFVRSVYDGDTARVDISLPFGIWISNQPVRLMGIDAPEVTGVNKPLGLAARDRLRELSLNKDVFICTDQDRREKYGRVLVRLMTLSGIDLNDLLVEEGHAVYREY